MSQPATEINARRKELDGLLEARGLSGLWNVKGEDRTAEPKTTVRTSLWKWADVHDSLLRARERHRYRERHFRTQIHPAGQSGLAIANSPPTRCSSASS